VKTTAHPAHARSKRLAAPTVREDPCWTLCEYWIHPAHAGHLIPVRATTGARALKTFPVEVRDGAIWLIG
jgi:hypothetical protein